MKQIHTSVSRPIPAAVIVTRHPAMVTHLQDTVPECRHAPVVAHAAAHDVAGKHVYGVLPLSLAVLADRVTEVPLSLPRALRGQELTLKQVRQHAGDPVTYTVGAVSPCMWCGATEDFGLDMDGGRECGTCFRPDA